ncbi:hypothetical protein ABW19_dt0205557 [Dactylella cylindrospora]|nr:hypothetical protein ABW19_dt0205557 [Dactylella cylindrospora]
MGFWTRNPVAAADSSSPIAAAASHATNDPPPIPPTSQSPSTSTSPQPTKSRDDLAAEELSAFLQTLQTSSPQDSPTSPSPSSPVSFQDTLYPTTMSCREAFDELYFCYSLGGQFKNLYRYGTYRDCSDKSADFWFCMRTKMYGPEAKKEMIVRYHKEKEAERYKRGPSSEDVWSVRTEPLGGQFMGVPGEEEGGK